MSEPLFFVGPNGVRDAKVDEVRFDGDYFSYTSTKDDYQIVRC